MARPTKYKKEYCEQVIRHLRTGASLASFASSIGTHREVLWQWRKRHEEFNHACNIAMEASQAWYENLALMVATGKAMEIEDDPSKPRFGKPKLPNTNPGMIQFIMKQRFRDYREKTEVKNDLSIIGVPSEMSDEELDRKLEEALEVIAKNGSKGSGSDSKRKTSTKKTKTANQKSKKKST
jgi:hypothetical protein